MSNSTEPDLEGAEVQHPGGSDTDHPRKCKPAIRLGYAHRDVNSPVDPISTIWEQVKEKNSSGHYNFERFESMQLLNLCLFQYDLRELAQEIYTTMDNSKIYPAEHLHEKVERLRPMLKECNEALMAVHEIMSYQKAVFKTIGPYDTPKIGKVPFLMTDLRRELEPDGWRQIVEKLIPDKFKKSNFFSIGPRRELNTGPWINIRDYTWARAEEHEKEGLKRLVDNVARFTVSFFGGASLLVPMIIMMFSDSRDANIIVTCTFVLFFGLVLSLGSRASNQEILAATAGYAAVLVVFIGTSGAGTQ